MLESADGNPPATTTRTGRALGIYEQLRAGRDLAPAEAVPRGAGPRPSRPSRPWSPTG
jgi:hypothetical protein